MLSRAYQLTVTVVHYNLGVVFLRAKKRGAVRRGLAFFLKLQNHVVRFSSPKDRIDRFPEPAHAVIARGARPIKPSTAPSLRAMNPSALVAM